MNRTKKKSKKKKVATPKLNVQIGKLDPLYAEEASFALAQPRGEYAQESFDRDFGQMLDDDESEFDDSW